MINKTIKYKIKTITYKGIVKGIVKVSEFHSDGTVVVDNLMVERTSMLKGIDEQGEDDVYTSTKPLCDVISPYNVILFDRPTFKRIP